MHIRYMLFKFFFATKDFDTVLALVHSIATIDIHLMFDNFGLKCTLNASSCVQYSFDELGQVAARIRLLI
jgi:hypothetical protein